MSCFVFPLHRNTFHNHLAFFPLQVPFSELLFRHVFYCSLCKFSLNPLCRQFLLEPVTQCRFSCQHEESPVNRLIVLSESGRERDRHRERESERAEEFFQIILEIVSHSSCLTCDWWKKDRHILSAHKFKSCFIQFFGRGLCQLVTRVAPDHFCAVEWGTADLFAARTRRGESAKQQNLYLRPSRLSNSKYAMMKYCDISVIVLKGWDGFVQ